MFRGRVTRPEGISNTEWYRVRQAESVASREAIAAGAFKGLWKVAGSDEVIGIIDADSADLLDEALYSLPLWREGMETVVEIEWTPLRPYEHWGEQLDRIVEEIERGERRA